MTLLPDTGLTELKHAGFHVLIIGHLAKKYQTNGSSLSDVGLRVLADENITYEADAVLLVERSGAKRTVTPIIKPPRQRHLQLNQEYPAALATLFPDQAVAETPARKGAAATTPPANVTPFLGTTARASSAPKSPREAERRFYARYGAGIGGTDWAAVEAFLGYSSDTPKTVEDWVEVAGEVKAKLDAAHGAAA